MLFLKLKLFRKKMNHQKVYEKLIEKAKSENRQRLNKKNISYVYYENHHILPKCLGGGNKKENKVLLSAREHYVCHKLLMYIYKGNKKIAYAFHLMTTMNSSKYRISSRDYERAREVLIEFPPFKGSKHTDLSKKKQSDSQKKEFKEGRIQWNTGKTFNDDYKANMSRVISEIMKNGVAEKISLSTTGEKNHFFGKTHSLASIKKMSEAKKGKSLEEIYGKEKAEELKKINSKRQQGHGNNMYGISLMDKWIQKYGTEEALRRYIEWKNNLIKAKQKKSIYYG